MQEYEDINGTGQGLGQKIASYVMNGQKLAVWTNKMTQDEWNTAIIKARETAKGALLTKAEKEKAHTKITKAKLMQTQAQTLDAIAKRDSSSLPGTLLRAGCYAYAKNWPYELLVLVHSTQGDSNYLKDESSESEDDDGDVGSWLAASKMAERHAPTPVVLPRAVEWKHGDYARHVKYKNVYVVSKNGPFVTFKPLETKQPALPPNNASEVRAAPEELTEHTATPLKKQVGDFLFGLVEEEQKCKCYVVTDVGNEQKGDILCTYTLKEFRNECTDGFTPEVMKATHTLKKGTDGKLRFDIKSVDGNKLDISAFEYEVFGDLSTAPIDAQTWSDLNYTGFYDLFENLQVSQDWRKLHFKRVYGTNMAQYGVTTELHHGIARTALRLSFETRSDYSELITQKLISYLHNTARWVLDNLKSDAAASVTQWFQQTSTDAQIVAVKAVGTVPKEYTDAFDDNNLIGAPVHLWQCVHDAKKEIQCTFGWNKTSLIDIRVVLNVNPDGQVAVTLTPSSSGKPFCFFEFAEMIRYANLIAASSHNPNVFRAVIPDAATAATTEEWEDTTEGKGCKKPEFWAIEPNKDWLQIKLGTRDKYLESCIHYQCMSELISEWKDDDGKLLLCRPGYEGSNETEVVGKASVVLDPTYLITPRTYEVLAAVRLRDIQDGVMQNYPGLCTDRKYLNLTDSKGTPLVDRKLPKAPFTVNVGTTWLEGWYNTVKIFVKDWQSTCRSKFDCMSGNEAWSKWCSLATTYQDNIVETVAISVDGITPRTVYNTIARAAPREYSDCTVFVERYQWVMFYNPDVWRFIKNWKDSSGPENPPPEVAESWDSEAESDEREVDAYAFGDGLLPDGFYTEEIAGGGFCLFAVIAYWLRKLNVENEENATHASCRTAICDYLAANQSEGWVPDETDAHDRSALRGAGYDSAQTISQTYEMWVENMRRQDAYGDQYVLQAASAHYKINLHVYKCEENKNRITETMYPEDVPEDVEPFSRTATLVNLDPAYAASHYRAVLRDDDYDGNPHHWTAKGMRADLNSVLTTELFPKVERVEGESILDVLRKDGMHTESTNGLHAYSAYLKYATEAQGTLIRDVCGDYLVDLSESSDIAKGILYLNHREIDPNDYLLHEEKLWVGLNDERQMMLLDAWYHWFRDTDEENVWGVNATAAAAHKIAENAEESEANKATVSNKVAYEFKLPATKGAMYLGVRVLLEGISKQTCPIKEMHKAFTDKVAERIKGEDFTKDTLDEFLEEFCSSKKDNSRWAACWKTVALIQGMPQNERHAYLSTKLADMDLSESSHRIVKDEVVADKLSFLIDKENGQYFYKPKKEYVSSECQMLKERTDCVSLQYALVKYSTPGDFNGRWAFGWVAHKTKRSIVDVSKEAKQKQIMDQLKSEFAKKQSGDRNAVKELLKFVEEAPTLDKFVSKLCQSKHIHRVTSNDARRDWVYTQLEALCAARKHVKKKERGVRNASVTSEWTVDYKSKTTKYTTNIPRVFIPDAEITDACKEANKRLRRVTPETGPAKSIAGNMPSTQSFKERVKELTLGLKDKSYRLPDTISDDAKEYIKKHVAKGEGFLLTVALLHAKYPEKYTPKTKATKKLDGNAATNSAISNLLTGVNVSYEHRQYGGNTVVTVSGTASNVDYAIELLNYRQCRPPPPPTICVTVGVAKHLCKKVNETFKRPPGMTAKAIGNALTQYLDTKKLPAKQSHGTVSAVDVAKHVTTYPEVWRKQTGAEILEVLHAFALHVKYPPAVKFVLIAPYLQSMAKRYLSSDANDSDAKKRARTQIKDVYLVWVGEHNDPRPLEANVTSFAATTGLEHVDHYSNDKLVKLLQTPVVYTVKDVAL